MQKKMFKRIRDGSRINRERGRSLGPALGRHEAFSEITKEEFAGPNEKDSKQKFGQKSMNMSQKEKKSSGDAFRTTKSGFCSNEKRNLDLATEKAEKPTVFRSKKVNKTMLNCFFEKGGNGDGEQTRAPKSMLRQGDSVNLTNWVDHNSTKQRRRSLRPKMRQADSINLTQWMGKNSKQPNKITKTKKPKLKKLVSQQVVSKENCKRKREPSLQMTNFTKIGTESFDMKMASIKMSETLNWDSVGPSLQGIQKEESKTKNLKQLRDFLEKVSKKVTIYNMKDISEGFIVMNEINLKENRLFKKLLRSSDLGRFSGKFFELEKLGSNKFYQRLKVSQNLFRKFL